VVQYRGAVEFYCPYDRADQEPYILPTESYKLKDYVECCHDKCCTKVSSGLHFYFFTN
jgi:hypothetical protein